MSRLLSQDEVDALLGQAREEGRLSADEREDPSAPLPTYRFEQSKAMEPADLDAIGEMHRRTSRLLGTRLTSYVRCEVAVQPDPLETTTRAELCRQLSWPSVVGLYRTPKSRLPMGIHIEPRLAQALVDMTLGGPGELPADARTELNDVEAEVITDFYRAVGKGMDESMSRGRPLELRLAKVDVDARTLPLGQPGESLMLLPLQIAAGSTHGRMSIALPSEWLPHLQPVDSRGGLEDASPQSDESRQRLRRHLQEVPFRVSAELGGITLRVGELIRLAPGTIVTSGTPVSSGVTVTINGCHKFRGRPCAVQGRKAIRLFLEPETATDARDSDTTAAAVLAPEEAAAPTPTHPETETAGETATQPEPEPEPEAAPA